MQDQRKEETEGCVRHSRPLKELFADVLAKVIVTCGKPKMKSFIIAFQLSAPPGTAREHWGTRLWLDYWQSSSERRSKATWLELSGLTQFNYFFKITNSYSLPLGNELLYRTREGDVVRFNMETNESTILVTNRKFVSI